VDEEEMKSIKRRFSPHSPFPRERNIHCALRTGLALWLSLKKSRGSLRRGPSFRAAYYRWRDRFDRIRVVNDAGKYLQTMDHRFLRKHFAVESKCREASVYGRNRAKLLAMLILVPGEK
jgi:hypothetical protein